MSFVPKRPLLRTAIFSSMAIAFLLSLLLVNVGTETVSADDLMKVNRDQQRVAKLIASIMTDDHLSRHPLNDEISRRAFDQFVKTLDPTKSYFMQSDINEFEIRKNELDDMLRSGDFSLALDMYKRFLQRVDQRSELAVELVDLDHDFSIAEDMVTDRDALTFAATEEEARESWRKRIKYNLLVMKDDNSKKDTEENDDATEMTPADQDNDGSDDIEADEDRLNIPEEDPRGRLRKRFLSFAKRTHQTSAEDIVEMFITSLTSSYDPHTSYMSRGTYENFEIQMNLQLEGIGATLQADDDGYTVIKSLVPGGACDTQGGIEVEDKIIAVAQGDKTGARLDFELAKKHGTELIDVVGMKLNDVVGMIRGSAGTVVRLSVQSANSTELHTVGIVREKIKLEDSAAHGQVFEKGTNPDGSPQKIGVIELPSFYADMGGNDGGRSTTTDMRRILNDFNSQNVDALVVDLRRNGGGSLKEAIDCTGLFIDIGPVVQVKDAYGQIRKLNDEIAGTSWDKPMVVLTSKFSASASEILAGAIQDYGRGIVVGDTTTHGKGTVQSLIDLNEIVFRLRNPPNKYGALKITMQQFYRPNGDSTQKRGVPSDLVLPSFSDKMDVSESDLDYPVEFDRIPQASFPKMALVTPAIQEQLTQKSAARTSDLEDFQKLKRRIEQYVEQKNLKKVSLNEEVFLARRKELNADKEDEKTFEKQITPGTEIERTFYLEEVLDITSDYVELLRKQS